MSDPRIAYVDDPTIGDDAPLWRRIPPWHYIFDDNLQRWRPTTAAFEDHPDGTPMSVVLEQEVLDAGRSPQSVLTGHEQFGLVSFRAGLARQNRQGVIRFPLPEEPAHAEVFGKKTESVKKSFARNCEWLILPSQDH